MLLDPGIIWQTDGTQSNLIHFIVNKYISDDIFMEVIAKVKDNNERYVVQKNRI